MAAAATDHSTFPLFLSLPRELRDHIWRATLPDKVGPALYFYKKGCWCPRRLSESDKEYDFENNENNVNFEFRHDLLDKIQFEIPLAFVNREARGIVLAWVSQQGLVIRPRKGKQYPVFVRFFDPKRDALYVAPDRWDDFLCEPDERRFQTDLFEQLVAIKTDVTHLALPEALLGRDLATLPEMFQYFYSLETLFVVVDAPPDLQSANSDLEEQQWWEFKRTEGRACFWNYDCRRLDFGDGDDHGDEALYRLIQQVSQGLGEGLATNHVRSFEIWAGSAVRR